MTQIKKMIAMILLAVLSVLLLTAGATVVAFADDTTEYDVTVIGGTADKTTATVGETVTITADDPEDGKIFNQWAHVDGVNYEYADAWQTTFTMPAKDVTIDAVIRDIVVTDTIWDEVYTGEPFEPTFSFFGVQVEGSGALWPNTNYSLSYEDNVNVGTAKVIITITDRRKGSKTVTFEILPAEIEANMATISEQTYNGDPIEPEPVVTWNGKTLVKDKDYTLSYDNNVNVGQATVTATGKGNFQEKTIAEGTFKIVPGIITVTAPTAKSLTYNGSAQELVTAGEADGGTMQYALGTDAVTSPEESAYSTSIPTGIDPKTYYVWYRAVGDANHKDTEPECIEVTIAKRPSPSKISIDGAAVVLDDTPLVYDGEDQSPEVLTIGGRKFRAGIDYSVTYMKDGSVVKSTADAGTYTMIISGKGSYTGSTSTEFTIESQGFDGAEVVLESASFVYDGTAHLPVIKTIGGKTLEQGKDFDVRYRQGDAIVESPTDAGAYTMTVTGKGNYKGSASTTFEISKAQSTMTAKGRTVRIKSKAKKLKKAKKISAKKAYTINNPAGKVKYKKVKASRSSGKFKVDKKTGKITVKKGIKRGTYKLTVRVTDPGSRNYEGTVKNVVVKIKVNK